MLQKIPAFLANCLFLQREAVKLLLYDECAANEML
jgi:hypothetical protein